MAAPGGCKGGRRIEVALVRAAPEEPRPVAVPVAVFLARALVVLLLAFREPERELRAALAPIQLERDERVALALDEPREAIDLAPVHQQLANARGRRAQRRDVRAVQPRFAAAHHHEAIDELRFARAEALHFPALERKSGFVAFLDEVVETRLFVLRDRARRLAVL